MSVASIPIAFDSGPVSAKLIGVRPIETNQSRLWTRPRRSGGTRVDISVPQTTMPPVMQRAVDGAEDARTATGASRPRSPTSGRVATVHIAYMNVR